MSSTWPWRSLLVKHVYCLRLCIFNSSLDDKQKKGPCTCVLFMFFWAFVDTKFLWAYYLGTIQTYSFSHFFIGIHIVLLNDNRCCFHFCKSSPYCLVTDPHTPSLCLHSPHATQLLLNILDCGQFGQGYYFTHCGARFRKGSRRELCCLAQRRQFCQSRRKRPSLTPARHSNSLSFWTP